MVFKTIAIGFAIVTFGIIVAAATSYFIANRTETSCESADAAPKNTFVTKASLGNTAVKHVDLTGAAEKSVHAVVHIKSTQKSKTRTVRRAPDIYDFFFVISLLLVSFFLHLKKLFP